MTAEEIAAAGFFCRCSPWDVTAGAEDGNRCPRCFAYASAADERAAAAARDARRSRALQGCSSPRGPGGEFVDDHDAALDSWVDLVADGTSEDAYWASIDRQVDAIKEEEA